MDGIWPIVFLAVILKIPVFAGMYLVWYAVKAVPEEEGAPPPSQSDHGFRRWRRDPVGPRRPRRDPHGGAQQSGADCPSEGRRRRPIRTRAVAGRARAHD